MPATVDLVALSLLPVWQWRTIREQLLAGLSPATILCQRCEEAPRRTTRGRRVVCDVGGLRSRAAAALVRAERLAIDAVAVTSSDYPTALAAIDDPPPVLWTRGPRTALDAPSVAIVGSRAGSAYALTVAEQLAADLAAEKVTVVSGLARGVDSAAHRGALSVKGCTVAVLGCGVDVVYPPEHAALSRDIATRGALVSEFVPGTPPHPRFFPQRNRIISGLVRAVVVVEAGEKSGSLITARCALEQGRDVLAVPGSILNGRNRGGHALLRDGAKIVESVDDILEELGAGPDTRGSTARPGPLAPDGSGIVSAGQEILTCMVPGEPCDLDLIATRLGLGAAELLPRLFELEIRGLVRRAGGGRFMRVDRSC